MPAPLPEFPRIATVGLTGMLVQFADTLSEPANRAAIAFRAAMDREGWLGVEETSSTLASAFVRFDPLGVPHAVMRAQLEGLLATRDWYQAEMPEGRRLHRIPVVFGGEAGPQFAEAAALAGLSEPEAIASLTAARPRVLNLGYAPGMPYSGQLGPEWDIPRMTKLNPQAPQGALVVAIRQAIIFANATPTGWRHVGTTAFRCFRPEAASPFTLRPGDELAFHAVSPEEMAAIRSRDPQSGGATVEALA
jgi:KipI family sensor histidine kinase inhibitor